jgi:hypothetical protein
VRRLGQRLCPHGPYNTLKHESAELKVMAHVDDLIYNWTTNSICAVFYSLYTLLHLCMSLFCLLRVLLFALGRVLT